MGRGGREREIGGRGELLSVAGEKEIDPLSYPPWKFVLSTLKIATKLPCKAPSIAVCS